jgi:hypothetical protein
VGGYTSVKDSGNRRQFATGAVRDVQTGKGRQDLIPAIPLDRIAKHYENGAAKYGDDNWMKGIPLKSFLDSALRHLHKWEMGMYDEDHLAAAIFNIMGLIHTEEMIDHGILPKSLDNINRLFPKTSRADVTLQAMEEMLGACAHKLAESGEKKQV